MKKKFVLSIIAFLFLVFMSVLVYSIQTGKLKPSAAAEPTLSLSPGSLMVNVGQTFNVNILLDTAGQAVDGVDIFYLHYNPQILEVQDADAATAGVQIKTGSIFPSYLGNTVDPTTGKISISGIVTPGSTTGYSGSGIFATVNFKALAAATSTSVYFDFTPGLTTDTNIAEHANPGHDILAAVNNGSYTINSGQSSLPLPSTPSTSTSTNSTSTSTKTSAPKTTSTSTITPTPTLISSPTAVSQTPEQPPIIGGGPSVRTSEPTPTQITSGTPMAYLSPEQFSPSPSASPGVKVAGLNQSTKIALIIFGAGLLLTIIVYLIWNWYRKRKAAPGPSDDELI